MKFHSDKFLFLNDGRVRGRTATCDFINKCPRFDYKRGQLITNPFTYMVVEVLERVLWELSAKEFASDLNIQIHMSIVQDEYNDYWVEAEVDTDVDEIEFVQSHCPKCGAKFDFPRSDKWICGNCLGEIPLRLTAKMEK